MIKLNDEIIDPDMLNKDKSNSTKGNLRKGFAYKETLGHILLNDSSDL